jgi:hypothetical protein
MLQCATVNPPPQIGPTKHGLPCLILTGMCLCVCTLRRLGYLVEQSVRLSASLSLSSQETSVSCAAGFGIDWSTKFTTLIEL